MHEQNRVLSCPVCDRSIAAADYCPNYLRATGSRNIARGNRVLWEKRLEVACESSTRRGYLERFGLGVGYLLSFNFNQSKEPGLSRVVVGDSVLWEETV